MLSLATNESWKNLDTGEWESRAEWHNVVAFGKLGEFAATLRTGAHIEVEGALSSRERNHRNERWRSDNPDVLYQADSVESWMRP